MSTSEDNTVARPLGDFSARLDTWNRVLSWTPTALAEASRKAAIVHGKPPEAVED